MSIVGDIGGRSQEQEAEDADLATHDRDEQLCTLTSTHKPTQEMLRAQITHNLEPASRMWVQREKPAETKKISDEGHPGGTNRGKCGHRMGYDFFKYRRFGSASQKK